MALRVRRGAPVGPRADVIRHADHMSDFEALRGDVREFVAERDWGQFHDPKSLLLALMGELGELSELFQWLPASEAAAQASVEPLRSRVHDEMSDVLIYLLCLADALDTDIVEVAHAKLVRNRGRWVVAQHRGRAPDKT